MRPPACRHSSRDHMATISAKSRVCPHEERPQHCQRAVPATINRALLGGNVSDGRSPKCPPRPSFMLCATGSARAVSGERCEILMDAAQHEILLMARGDVTADSPCGPIRSAEGAAELARLTAERRSGARPARTQTASPYRRHHLPRLRHDRDCGGPVRPLPGGSGTWRIWSGCCGPIRASRGKL